MMAPLIAVLAISFYLLSLIGAILVSEVMQFAGSLAHECITELVTQV